MIEEVTLRTPKRIFFTENFRIPEIVKKFQKLFPEIFKTFGKLNFAEKLKVALCARKTEEALSVKKLGKTLGFC